MGPRSENRGYPVRRGCQPIRRMRASMGPRSENRGYARACASKSFHNKTMLQWVHGPRTVVMPFAHRLGSPRHVSFNGSTVREPWLCVARGACSRQSQGRLQWVHGPRTVVMPRGCMAIDLQYTHASMGPRSENRGYPRAAGWSIDQSAAASMGPRSENRGYRRHRLPVTLPDVGCFNGSTVREPWLAVSGRGLRRRLGARSMRFNGSTVREPWLS